MIRTTIRTPPPLSDFTPLAEHQEQTPQSFYDGKPILHYFATGAKAWLPKSQLGKLPLFPADLSSEPTGPEGIALNGTVEENVEQKVDLYVNSQTFTIFCPATESGLSIPYHQISIHAIKTIGAGDQTYQSVFLQIELENGESSADGDGEYDTVELVLIPTSITTPTPTTEATPTTTTPTPEATKLFNAITECSNLNPDPADSDEEESNADRIIFEADYEPLEGYEGVYVGSGAGGGLPPPMPGSSGWITAENMHEYFDGEGNWIGEGQVVELDVEDEAGVSGELGEGAGTVHKLDEDEGDAPATAAGGGEQAGVEEKDGGESKRLRVE